MTHVTQFSSDADERWNEISDFPNYEVSNWGRVRNAARLNRIITPTYNTGGVVIVGLQHEGKQVKRSLSLLVAKAFLPAPESEAFDTAIHRNGDRTDNHADNLLWRPLWFARKYLQQFSDNHPTILTPIEDVATGVTYATSMDASMVHGVMDLDIVFSIHNNVYVWPTRQTFRRAN